MSHTHVQFLFPDGCSGHPREAHTEVFAEILASLVRPGTPKETDEDLD